MRNKKLLVTVACALAAMGLFASEGTLLPHQVGVGWSLSLNEKMMLLALQIGVILFAAKLGGMFASLMKLPSVLGELGVGIAIGPWALGGIGFGSGIFQYGLFRGLELRQLTDAAIVAGANTPFTVTPELYGICTIASVVLLFLSGIETNLKMFLKFAFAGSLVGVGGVIFSFLFGDLCAVYAVSFFPDLLGDVACLAKLHAYVQNGEVMKAVLDPGAMFMGIMSTATSVGITARILSERKKMDTAEGVTIMAGAVIDDVLGIIVLAIGMGIIGTQAANAVAGTAKAGVPWGSIGMTALKAIGVWLGGTVLGVLFARKISWLLKLFKSPVAIAILAFGLSLVIAGLFEILGLTLIIGAYVIGLSLSRTDIKHLIEENLQPVYTFLVPVFFCVMGMMVDVSALCSKPVLIFGGVYTVLAILAKQIGCALPTFLCGFNMKGGLRVGAGMIARGEVALIVAGIGLANGYLTQEIFGIGILMTLVTTVVAPPCLVGLFNLKGGGMRKSRRSSSDDGSRNVTFELSSPVVAEMMLGRLVDELRTEGFFMSELSKEDGIWEAAMDDIEFAIQRDGSVIHIACTPTEEAMVMTAWMEVVSQMNDLARAISRPIRRDDLGKMLRQEDKGAPLGHSGVGRYLQGFVMLPKFRAASKKEAIGQMVAEVAKACPNHVKDADAATEAVLKREESMATGLDHGIAVPHGRSSDVIGIAGAVAILDNEGTANGCIPDYETIDNSPLQIIVLTLANDEQQTPYLQLMSFISRALRSNDGYKRLLECRTADEMRAFFRSIK